MPYIKSNNNRREKLQQGEPAKNAGELNYQIFYYIKHYYNPDEGLSANFKRQIEIYVENFLGAAPNYQKYNDMTGCLIRCKKEVERRLGFRSADFLECIMERYDDEIAEYEDKKIIENKDVE
jgi:hypothetical protein